MLGVAIVLILLATHLFAAPVDAPSATAVSTNQASRFLCEDVQTEEASHSMAVSTSEILSEALHDDDDVQVHPLTERFFACSPVTVVFRCVMRTMHRDVPASTVLVVFSVLSRRRDSMRTRKRLWTNPSR